MFDLKLLIPELFLSVSIFSLLMLGVFLKNSFEIIYRLSIFVIFLILLIILSGENDTIRVLNDSFEYRGVLSSTIVLTRCALNEVRTW